MLIIGILTAIAIPVYQDVSGNAQRNACFANQRIIEEAVQVFRGDYKRNPLNLQELVDEGYFSVKPQCPSDEDAYDLDDTGKATTDCRHGYYRD